LFHYAENIISRDAVKRITTDHKQRAEQGMEYPYAKQNITVPTTSSQHIV